MERRHQLTSEINTSLSYSASSRRTIGLRPCAPNSPISGGNCETLSCKTASIQSMMQLTEEGLLTKFENALLCQTDEQDFVPVPVFDDACHLGSTVNNGIVEAKDRWGGRYCTLRSVSVFAVPQNAQEYHGTRCVCTQSCGFETHVRAYPHHLRTKTGAQSTCGTIILRRL